MRRRDFLSTAATAAALIPAAAMTGPLVSPIEAQSAASGTSVPLGLLITPSEGPEETIRRVHDLGLPTCFFSLDAYIGKFTPQLAHDMRFLLAKY